MPTVRALVIELAVMTAVGFVLAAIGPYGSFALGSFARRLSYWLPAAYVGYILVRPFMSLAELAQRRLDLPRPLVLGAAVLVSAVPATFFILWLNGNSLSRLPKFENWFQLYLQIALIGGIVTLLFLLLETRGKPEQAGSTIVMPVSGAAADMPEVPPFLSRLPPHLRDGLLALQMEDHYVRAHGETGSALVLLRMRDAVAELAESDGMRVHRSWWVARNAVEWVRQDGRNFRLILKGGGLEVPVARNAVPALRAAGWFGRERERLSP